MEKKVTVEAVHLDMNFATHKNLEEGFIKMYTHRVSVSENFLNMIQKAIFELEMRGVYREDIRITAPPVVVSLIERLLYVDNMATTASVLNTMNKEHRLFGVKCNFEHPYLEIVIHDKDAWSRRNLITKIDIEGYYES